MRSNLSNNLPPGSRDFSEYLEPVDCVFNFSNTTDDAVLRKILKLKSNKGVGPDNISPKLIKDSAEVIAPYLIIFNLLLSEGKFPDDWKSAKVCPIFKSDKRDECANYGPISILSAISKIFEKLVFEQLVGILLRMRF